MSERDDDTNIITLLTDIQTRLAALETKVEQNITEVTSETTKEDAVDVQTSSSLTHVTGQSVGLGQGTNQQQQAVGSAASINGNQAQGEVSPTNHHYNINIDDINEGAVAAPVLLGIITKRSGHYISS